MIGLGITPKIKLSADIYKILLLSIVVALQHFTPGFGIAYDRDSQWRHLIFITKACPLIDIHKCLVIHWFQSWLTVTKPFSLFYLDEMSMASPSRFRFCVDRQKNRRFKYDVIHHACLVRDAIVLPLLNLFHMDEQKGFEYATCGRIFFLKQRKKSPFSKISGYVLLKPISWWFTLRLSRLIMQEMERS